MISKRGMILGVAFPLAVVVLALNVAITFRNVRALSENSRRAIHLRTTLSEIAMVLSLLKDAETGQRGYLLTGDEVYLGPYGEAIRALPGKLDQLATLTVDNPSVRVPAASLKRLAEAKISELSRTVALYREGRNRDAVQEVEAGRGKQLMDRARALAADMEGTIRRSLLRNGETSRLALRRTLETFLIATLVAVALLVLAATLNHRELAERERRAEAVRASEARLATTFQSIGDAVITADQHGRIERMNPVAEALTGYRLGEAAGKPIEEVLRFVDEATRQPAKHPAPRVVREGAVLGRTNHMLLIARDGREVPIDHSASPIKDARGAVLGVISVFRDVTDGRQIEAERERLLAAERTARAEAEEANQAKDQFLAVLSHELRTPLNPIMLAVTSMLERPVPAEEIRPTLEMIRENVALEARLIDDLLDVMRIARGKMSLQCATADCHSLIRHALQICRGDVQDKALGVVLHLSAAEHHVHADSARLEQVFWNLIKNAVKFTPTGGSIEIRTRNEPESPGGPTLLIIEFIDTGIGIAPETLPSIFDPFQQGEGSITRRFGGMGLGLAIGRGVVEAHGGQLTAASAGKDQGSTFRVQLRALDPRAVQLDAPRQGEPAPAALAAAQAGAPPKALRILLVEDEPATLGLMARLLRALGHEVTPARTLGEALQAAEETRFDLIVSDIGLPDGSGLDLMRQVAARGNVPAISLTGYGMEEDIRRSQEAGFSAHLTKPIDFNKLEAVIRQVAGRPA